MHVGLPVYPLYRSADLRHLKRRQDDLERCHDDDDPATDPSLGQPTQASPTSPTPRKGIAFTTTTLAATRRFFDGPKGATHHGHHPQNEPQNEPKGQKGRGEYAFCQGWTSHAFILWTGSLGRVQWY